MASDGDPVYQIFSFQDSKYSPDPIHELPAHCLTSTPAPIVIDNGSFQTRAGWAAPAPFDSPRLVFRSVAARCRGAARSETQIGNDIPNLEPLRWLLKSQFDRNVVVNFEIQELIFDYIFTHMGITSEVSGSNSVNNTVHSTKNIERMNVIMAFLNNVRSERIVNLPSAC